MIRCAWLGELDGPGEILVGAPCTKYVSRLLRAERVGSALAISRRIASAVLEIM